MTTTTIKTLNTTNHSYCSYDDVVFRRSQKLSSRKRRISRSFTTRASSLSSSSSSSDEKEKNVNIALVGQETSTGKLVMGLSAGRGNNNNNTISVVFGEKMENSETMTEGMDEQTFEKRFYCTKEQFAKISTFASERSASTVSASSTTTTYIFCHESGAKQMKAMKDLKAMKIVNSGEVDDKCVLLSRVGINRKEKAPFKTQNEPYQQRETVQIGQIALPIGNAVGEPIIGTLDGYEQSEEFAKEIFGAENVTVVRSGELRGNGPLLLADLSARLVDNMYDVKFQDLYVFQGDSQQGYTKRLNLAQTLVRVAENSSSSANRDISVLSVICKTVPIVGEQTLSQPTDRERRKGYDMSKGIAPSPIDINTVDSLLANPK
tara:strand:- start:306 stop:1436 length:1131 start_codon:yes stop_codon:yes gene_type:complete